MKDVYFLDFQKTKDRISSLKKGIGRLDIKEMFDKKKLIAVKTHFGEKGNTAYIKPIYVNTVCEILEREGFSPFLTDTNTLYRGERINSVSHLINASFNGFSHYPVIIADGLKGESSKKVEINGKIFKDVHIASDIFYAEGMVVVSHFKGHEVTGFGGAIKNIGMGCAARKGKLAMHSHINPTVSDNCIGCMKCIDWCQVKAIEKKEGKAYVNPEKCVGCALCIEVCPNGSIRINWDMDSDETQRRIVEYAYGAVKNKKVIYINVITEVSKACDCYPFSSLPLVEDIGIMISSDPVAVDKASYDAVVKAFKGDPFAEHNGVDSLTQIKYGESIGLGSSEYNIVNI